MDIHQINPWNFGDVLSPDHTKKFFVAEIGEVAMGAPLSAVGYYVSEDIKYLISRSCGGPVVWSDDSRYIALPIWNADRQQRLGIFDTVSKRLVLLPDQFMVLHVKVFSKETVSGIHRRNGVDEPFDIHVSSYLSNI